MTQIEEVELREMLNRLRPAIGYTWRGSGLRLAAGETWDDVVIWTDGGSIKPTEAEMIIEYDLVLVERAVLATDKQTVQDEIDSFSLVRSDYVLAFELMNKLVNAFANGQTPTLATVYSNFITAINGSNLEANITAYITMQTGLTDFAPTIPDSEKRDIMQNGIDFLQTLILVGIVKGLI